MQISESVRFHLRNGIRQKENTSTVFPQQIAKELQVHISKISRSLRDLECQQEIIRHSKNENGEIVATLLPKFFQKTNSYYYDDKETVSDPNIVIIRPLLFSSRQKLDVSQLFPYLFSIANENNKIDNKNLINESKLAIKFLSRIIKICPEQELKILSLIVDNMEKDK